MGQLRAADPVPLCPMCDGPCRHEFERSEYVFPDRLKHTPGDPVPEKEPKPNRRGKRKRAVHGPEQDRAIKPTEDRSAK